MCVYIYKCKCVFKYAIASTIVCAHPPHRFVHCIDCNSLFLLSKRFNGCVCFCLMVKSRFSITDSFSSSLLHMNLLSLSPIHTHSHTHTYTHTHTHFSPFMLAGHATKPFKNFISSSSKKISSQSDKWWNKKIFRCSIKTESILSCVENGHSWNKP